MMGRVLMVAAALVALAPGSALAQLLTGAQDRQATSEFKRLAEDLERRFDASSRGMATVKAGGSLESRGRWLEAARLTRAEAALKKAHDQGVGAMFKQAGAVMKFGKALAGPLGIISALSAQSRTWVAQEEARFAEARVVFWARRTGTPVGPNLRRRALHSLTTELNSAKRDLVEANVRLKQPRHGFFGNKITAPAHWKAQQKKSLRREARVRRQIRSLRR